MKQCTKCEEIKPLSEFNRDKNQRDGREFECRICRSKYQKKYNEINRSKRTKAGVEYYKANKIRMNQYQKRRRKREPLGYMAVDKLKIMTRSGKITRPNQCSKCNRECIPDGHHEDYNKPLDVIWLCRPCHKSLHGLERL